MEEQYYEKLSIINLDFMEIKDKMMKAQNSWGRSFHYKSENTALFTDYCRLEGISEVFRVILPSI